MKTSSLLFLAVFLSTISTYSQNPETFNYQAIVRDNTGAILANQPVTFQITIFDKDPLDSLIYRELHSVSTDPYGLVSLQIGNGTPTMGVYEDIKWSVTDKSIGLEVELTTGGGFISLGVYPLLYVPYALYAQKSSDSSFWSKSDSGICFNEGKIAVGTIIPEGSSIFEISSSTEGILIPRMTSIQRDVIPNPAEGLLIYNTTLDKFDYFNGNEWKTVLSTTSSSGSSAGGCGYCSEGVIDYDGHYYSTIKIGDQCWMAENLKSVYYADGTAISGHYAYQNDESLTFSLGRLYDWDAVMNGASSSTANPSGVQGICPQGWHVPSDEEWKELEKTMGMDQTEVDKFGWRGNHSEGKKLKDTEDSFFWYTNDGGTNSSGFTALPGGYRTYEGLYWYSFMNAYFWSCTADVTGQAWARVLDESHDGVHRYNPGIQDGFSVRCLKD